MTDSLCPRCNHYIRWHQEIHPGKALQLWYKLTGDKIPAPKTRCSAQIWDDPDVYCECTIDKFTLDVQKIS